MAGFAGAIALGSEVDVAVKGVSVDAVGLCRVVVTGIASLGIFLIGHRLKMIGVDAERNPTQVIEMKTIGNGAFVQFVRDAMGIIHLAIVTKDLPIANTIVATKPQPAAAVRFRSVLFLQTIAQ